LSKKHAKPIPQPDHYKEIDKAYPLMKPRVYTASISHQKRGGPQPNMWKIPKQPKEEDGPGPGEYDTLKFFAKTRPSIVSAGKFINGPGSEKRNTFITVKEKEKKKIPGPGWYKNAEDGVKLLCKSRQLISPR